MDAPRSRPDSLSSQGMSLKRTNSNAYFQQSQADVYLNGRCLASQKLNYVSPNVGGGQTHLSENQTVHAIVGTPPFLRRPTLLRWKMSCIHLIDEPLSIDDVRYISALQPHYVGNFQVCSRSAIYAPAIFQTVVNGAALMPEASISLSLNAISVVQMTLQSLRSMCKKADCDIVASLTGLSSHDNTTPLRLVWNCAAHIQGPPRPLGAVVIGYLGKDHGVYRSNRIPPVAGIRSFGPCPVSALLDSIGGVAPLLGLIAMCTDSQGLYASLKVLVSAVEVRLKGIFSLTTMFLDQHCYSNFAHRKSQLPGAIKSTCLSTRDLL